MLHTSFFFIVRKFVIALFLCTGMALPALSQTLHRLSFRSPEELHRFFSYEAGKIIVSGHRGTSENGWPENSIAGMEAVLKQTPAFFEVDPRLTKDSVVVLMHDATLERTTNGQGKVADYRWEDLKKLRLKDKDGKLTDQRIPTLAEAIAWARGKTVLNLDHKDVPLHMTADIIREHDAYAFVMVTVHAPEEARFYLDKNSRQMLSAHIKTPEMLAAYRTASIPFSRLIAYIGPDIRQENQYLYRQLQAAGVMCMMSAAPTYDKLATAEERAKAYRAIVADGASILESDFPIEVGKAIQAEKPR